jgi:hypothetical protein
VHQRCVVYPRVPCAVFASFMTSGRCMPRCALGPSRCSYHFPECIEDNINLSHEVQTDPQGVLLSQARRDLG